MAGNTSESGRSVSSKIASILSTFADVNQRSLAEVVRLTGLPVSTAHRLIAQLVEFRILERSEHAGYRVGLNLRMIRPADRSGSGTVDNRAVPVLSDLASATDCRIRLGVLCRHEVAYVEQRPPGDTAAHFIEGDTLPLCSSALGRVLLAYSQDVTELLIAQAMAGIGPPLPTSPDRFRAMLAKTRITRVAVNAYRGPPERYCMAMPVFGAGGEVVAGLALIVQHRHELRPLRAALSVACGSLSRDLATVPPGHGTTLFNVRQLKAMVAGQ